jgi:hypothetical protein
MPALDGSMSPDCSTNSGSARPMARRRVMLAETTASKPSRPATKLWLRLPSASATTSGLCA